MGSYKCPCGKKIHFSGALLSNEEITRMCAEKCAKKRIFRLPYGRSGNRVVR